MSNIPPESAPPPTSLPTPPTNSTAPPAIPSAPPPAIPSAPPPALPSSPPPAVPSAPPPAIPSSPPPAVPSAPPPAVPSAPPPAVPSAPPPTVPSSPPPTVPSVPPPTVPSSPPPSVPSAPPPAIPSASPPAVPSSPLPATPSSPSPTPPSLPSPPPPVTPSPPGTVTPSPPAPVTPTPPGPVTPSPPASSSGGGTPPVSGTPSTRASPPPPTSSSSDSGGSGVSTPVVVGIAVGGAAILLVLALIFIFCKKKRRRDRPSYGGPPPRKEEGYGGQAQTWQQNAPPPADHAINVPPPPGYASRPLQFPTPPPPMFSSSGASGSNYSGGPESSLPPPSPGMATLGFSKSTFTFDELVRATDGFSDANLLGQGGFGYVHRGILPNGKEVAVKQLKTGSGQGEREFQAEVEIISRVHHKHLVSLVGYCITGEKRLLVYEFVPNNTLEFHLHGKGRDTMDWPTRLKIALGSAKGLAYLHEDCHPKIIHRDIKASNILLDFKFEAMVADFGLAKFFSDNNTHVSTRVMGTFGYLAPEYASSGKLSEKSDVFSFGVVLLELVTGRRPIDTTNTYMDDSLVDWAKPLLVRAIEEKNFDALVDPRLEHNYNPNEMAQMLACAAACIRHSARRRPRMSQIVRALEGDLSLDDLHESGRPGNISLYSSYGSSDYDTGMYNEDLKKFKKLALTSQEYASSEYSQPTSEYGQNPSASSSEAQTREMEIEKMKKDSGGFI